MNKDKRIKHGFARTGKIGHFYHVWEAMNKRCNNPNHQSYKYYGGRGIGIVWKSFVDFKDDMYKSYLQHKKAYGQKNTLIERIDNNGNYCKENCSWKTIKEQRRNTSKNRLLTFGGKTFCMSQWGDIMKISGDTLWKRLDMGWSVKKTLMTPKLR